MKNIIDQLSDLLRTDERLNSQDGELLKNQAQELARKNDPALIRLLLSDSAIRELFFFTVAEITIFDHEKFIRFVSNKLFLPDSYTAFKNKIGLVTGNQYLGENKDVVLVWPYKDCVLEGGMTKEDQKRDEIFYNEVLAPDDVTRLLDPKVFVNFKRIDKDGEHPLDGFRRDENGTIKDNLIIKGNNLLALASLRKEFAGKVKLIYIDPPYNTGNDSFGYNDSFNHSAWLTFMKNRLDIARELLSKDGSICMNIDDDESHYLKVLADGVFGRENFVTNIIWQKKYAATNDTKYISDLHDHILVYAKNKKSWRPNLLARPEELNAKYSNPDNDRRGAWYPTNLSVKTFSEKNYFEIISPNGKKFLPPPSRCWVVSKEKYAELLADNRIWFGGKGDSRPYQKTFLSEVQQGVVPTSVWLHSDVGHTIGAKTEMRVLFPDISDLFATPKPEKLLQRVLEIGSKEHNLVLDFFAGSGTTLAVAQKMGRQYIGIEQMDYIHELPESRLKKVIAGEQGGISEAVNWQGGGDFVYMELAEWNEKWVKRIRDAETDKELVKIWDALSVNTFLSWKIDLRIFDRNAKDFADLSVVDRKKFLIQCLDLNQLYVNLSEIEDKEHAVRAEDKKLNKEFYK